MTKITTDAQPSASKDRLAIRLLVAAGFVTEEKANEALQIAHGFSIGPLEPAARLASTSPAPDGWVLPDHKVDDEDPEGFNNGWNCCLSAVRKAIAEPQPVVDNT